MNFLPEARVVCYDGRAKVLLEGIGQVVVPQQYVERAKQVENLNLIPPEVHTGSVIDAQVHVIEYLGDQLQVYLTAGGTRLVAMLNSRSRVSVGGTARLPIEHEQMHLFDTDTGKALF